MSKHPPNLWRLALIDVLAGDAFSISDICAKYGVAESTVRKWQYQWWRHCVRGDRSDRLMSISTEINSREKLYEWGDLACKQTITKNRRSFDTVVRNRDAFAHVLLEKKDGQWALIESPWAADPMAVVS